MRIQSGIELSLPLTALNQARPYPGIGNAEVSVARMFIRTHSSAQWGSCGIIIATLLVVTGCSQSSNPVAPRNDGDILSEEVPLVIPRDVPVEADRLDERTQAAKTGGDIVVYTFDDLSVDCTFNKTFPAVYQDLAFSDSRLISRCSFGGGVALIPADLAKFNSVTPARNLITLPYSATEVSIEATPIRDMGPRSFAAYDAAGVEIDRVSFTRSTQRVVLTVTGAIRQVGIIDFQGQTYWDNLTVTYGAANQPPIADAGPDQHIIVTETATIDGSGSSDPDDDALTYGWSWTATPDGSLAVFSSPTSVVTTFTVDLPGTYTAQLVVNDGTSDSAPSYVTVIVLPLSDAIAALGDDLSSLIRQGVLNGSQSNSLFRTLDFVQRKFESQPGVVLNKLNAFAAHVSGLVSGGVLTHEEGSALIGYADRIAAAIAKHT